MDILENTGIKETIQHLFQDSVIVSQKMAPDGDFSNPLAFLNSGSSGNRMGQKRCQLNGSGSGGIEVQPTTMKVNRCFESFLVSKSISPFLDGLDLGVQSFTHSIGDRMRDVRQNIVQMAFDQISDVFHGCDATSNRPSEPALPEGSGVLQSGRMPQSPKFLSHRPRPSHFQVHGPEGLKTLSLGFGQVFFRIQPKVFGSFQFGIESFPNFLLSDGIDGLHHMSHDVETVKDDLFGGLGEMCEIGLKERFPHIHRHRANPCLLLQGERGIKRVQRLGFPSFSHISIVPSRRSQTSVMYWCPLAMAFLSNPISQKRFSCFRANPRSTARFWILQASSQLIRRRAAALAISQAFNTSMARRSNILVKRPRASAQGTNTCRTRESNRRCGEPRREGN